MKQNEVKVGETYLTYIGESLARVVVVATRAPNTFHNRTRFVVKREGESVWLPKARSAAALRPLPPTRCRQETVMGIVIDYIDAHES